MIYRNFRRSLLVALVLLCQLMVLAQSPDIRTVNGEKFIVHEVKAGETIWAISQRYNMDITSINKNNPGAESKLSIGQVLLIPYDRTTKKELKNTPPVIQNGDVLHTVKKGETLFSLYKRYNVEVNDLIEANPELNNGLNVGMVIRIPKEKVDLPEAQIAVAVDDGSVAHQVQKGETVYGISKKYEISAEDLLAANGGLPEGLKAGAFVVIPVAKDPNDIDGSEAALMASSTTKTVYKVAYLLPFSIEENDSLMAKAAIHGDIEFMEETQAALHFYLGAMLAIDTLRKQGLSAEVFIEEVNNDELTPAQVAADTSLNDVDIFFGPFHRNSLEKIIGSAAIHGAHVVCPTPQSNKVVLGHNNLSKTRSSGAGQIPFVAKYIAKEHYADNIIMMEAPVWKELDMRDQMFNALNFELSRYLMKRSDSIQRCTIDKDVSRSLLVKLDPTALNVLVVPTNEVYYSSELMTRLSKLDDNIQIIVYGMQSWKDHQNIDATYKDQYRLHLPFAEFVDIKDPQTKAFIEAFRVAHGTNPSEFAFAGYDVSMFYLKGLLEFGTGFPQFFDKIDAETIHMEFDMKNTGMDNGFLNEHFYMLSYEDLQLKIVGK